MATSIEKQKLLLVEGQDEVSVFTCLCESIGITDLQIIESGGNIQLKNKFPAIIKSPGFSYVTSYAIVQDADTDPEAAFKRVQHLLKSHSQPVPTNVEIFTETTPKTGVFILPGAGQPGMLEDLYLCTLEGKSILSCIDACIADIESKCPTSTTRGDFFIPNNRAKSRTLGTLMATSSPHNRLGLAAKDGYWDFNHVMMNPLLSFLRNI